MGYDTNETTGPSPLSGGAQEILRRWRLVLVVALAALVAAVTVSATREDTYSAKLRLVVTPLSQGDERFIGISLIRDSGDAGRTAATVADGLDSSAVDAETAGLLGSGWTADSVSAAVSAKPVVEANLVEITAEADGAGRAVRLANTYAAATLDVRWNRIAGELERRIATLDDLSQTAADEGAAARDRDVLTTVLRSGRDPTLGLQGDAPKVDSDGIPMAAAGALGLLGGLFLGGLAALAMSLIGRRVTSEADVLSIYPVPVLARVHPDTLLRLADVLPELPRHEELGGLAGRIARAHRGGATIAMASASPGDGRSPAAASLRAAFAARKRKAAVVDTELDGAWADVAQLVATAREDTSYVLIDGPALSSDPRGLRACSLADLVLLVVRVGHTDRRDLRLARGLLERTGVVPAGMILVHDEGDEKDEGETPAAHDVNGAATPQRRRAAAR